MNFNSIIFLILLTLIACDNNPSNSKEQDQEKKNNISTDGIINEKRLERDTIQIEEMIKNLKPFKIDNFLIGRFLIGKEEKLAGYSSLSIKGDNLYEFDKNNNITAVYYSISNNYDNYTYDKSNRLIKEERKQYTPPETYNKTEYYYSENDETIKIVSTKLENNYPIKIDTLTDRNHLKKHEPNYYKRQVKQKYFSNNNENIITTFQENISFCCGFIMKGKNKLTYYLNDDYLIDSLVIKGIDNDKIKTLIYEYK